MIALVIILLVTGCAAKQSTLIEVQHCRLHGDGTRPEKTPCYLPLTDEQGKLMFYNRHEELEIMDLTFGGR